MRQRVHPITAPRALEHRPAGWVLSVVLVLTLGGMLWFDLATPSSSTVGGLSVLPVLVGAWLLSLPVAAAVTAVAVAFRLVAAVTGGVDVTTVVAQVTANVGVGLAVGVASGAAVTARQATLAERDEAQRAGETERRERAERERELTLLAEAAQILAPSIDPVEIQRQIVRAAALIVSPPGEPRWRASYLELQGDRLRAVAEYDDADVHLGVHEYLLATHPVLREVVESGTPIHGPLSAMAAPDATTEMVRRAGLTSAAMAPIIVDQRVIGMLALSTPQQHVFTPGQMARLMAVAHLAELAIANARRFAAEREHAEQSRLLEQSKSRFLNLASHEMRGPLTVIGGYLALIASGDLGRVDPRVSGVLPLVTGKVDELGRLVDQMLETARLEEGHLALVTEDTDLRTTVEGAVQALSPLLAESHRVVLEVCDGALPVRGDVARLTTVVINLVDNARKYSRAGTTIHIRCDAAGERVAVAVTDEGLGISPAEQAILFTRFGRIVNAASSHIPGTGLGLWLSREIARLHGGDIEVSSQAGQGSTFRLLLPRLQAPAPHGQGATAEGGRDDGAPPAAPAAGERA